MSGLKRYRSAPSSYFDSFLNGDDDFDQLLNPRICSPETQKIFARFMSGGGGDNSNHENCSQNPPFESGSQQPSKDEPDAKKPRQQLTRQRSGDYSSVAQVMFNQSGDVEVVNSDIKSSFDRLISSIDPNRAAQVKMEGQGLIRHSSSPAGLFDSISVEGGELGAMRGIGNFGTSNNPNRDAPFSSASRFKNNQKDLPPRNPSSLAKMAPISKGIGENRTVHGHLFDEDRGNDLSGFPLNQWDDSILSDDFFKGLVEDDDKTFPKADASDEQNDEGGNRTRLTHHLSLPTNSAAMEKLLQDSVPCKLRAKRGFATHPRSIAERVRRTKISDRIRKLQELVPNMDKQTNTADMLDLAVDYIKDLQKQVKTLSDNDAKCVCSAKQL